MRASRSGKASGAVRGTARTGGADQQAANGPDRRGDPTVRPEEGTETNSDRSAGDLRQVRTEDGPTETGRACVAVLLPIRFEPCSSADGSGAGIFEDRVVK